MPYNMKKGGGTANVDTPGSFSSKDTNTIGSLSKSAFGGTDPDPKKTEQPQKPSLRMQYQDAYRALRSKEDPMQVVKGMSSSTKQLFKGSSSEPIGTEASRRIMDVIAKAGKKK